MSTHREPNSTQTEAEENMAAFEAGLARLEAELRARLPEFFDESGGLIPGKVSQALRERAGGKTEFTWSEYLALVGRPGKPSSDAP